MTLKNVADYVYKVTSGDWTEAIKAAVYDAGNGGSVYFPSSPFPGWPYYYEFSDTIQFSASQRIIGDGQTVLRFTKRQGIGILLGSNCVLENMILEAPNFVLPPRNDNWVVDMLEVLKRKFAIDEITTELNDITEAELLSLIRKLNNILHIEIPAHDILEPGDIRSILEKINTIFGLSQDLPEQCNQDYLWSVFEEITENYDIPIDYIIENENNNEKRLLLVLLAIMVDLLIPPFDDVRSGAVGRMLVIPGKIHVHLNHVLFNNTSDNGIALTITHGEENSSGDKPRAYFNSIENCYFQRNYIAIHVENESNNNYFRNIRIWNKHKYGLVISKIGGNRLHMLNFNNEGIGTRYHMHVDSGSELVIDMPRFEPTGNGHRCWRPPVPEGGEQLVKVVNYWQPNAPRWV